MNNCIFCKIVKKELPASIVYEDNHVLAFLDIAPANKGHVLVVPKEHHADFLETPEPVLCYLTAKSKMLARKAMAAVSAEGFCLAVNTKPAAGQTVFHTHFHIIPRFSNDGLKHWPAKKFTADEMKSVQDAIKSA